MGKHEAEQIIQQLKDYQRTATSSRVQAIAALHRAGLVTSSGKPAKHYASGSKQQASKLKK